MTSRNGMFSVATRAMGLLWAVATCMWMATSASAISLPDGFQAVPAASGFDLPVLAHFNDDGLLFVVEKRGRVWSHDGATKSPVPLIDLRDEVNNDHDRGMLGFALQPGWTPDGSDASWVYFLYTVSPVFGQDMEFNQSNRYSFSRLKRCRTTTAGGWPVALLDDEDGDGEPCQIILGHQDADGRVDDGIASLHNSHSTCDLHFGSDGTLLVINGDGAHYNFADKGGQNAPAFQNFALTPPPGETAPWFGPMPLYEDSGAYRSQDLRSLAGKVLRIDPNTGLGVPSNPYFTGDPADHASKVWAGGIRNSFRSALVPGLGSANPADGDPGVLMLGEVGWGTWEEVNVVLGGENLGWPTYEGPYSHGSYSGWTRSPNPLGLPDGTALGGKNDPAAFQVHRLPVIAWHHSNASLVWPSGLHPGFKGNSSTGGDFYVGTSYPAPYHGAFFFADYAQQWIRALRYDGSYQATDILDFGTAVGGPVDIERHPILNDLYYVNIWDGTVYRLQYGENAPPQATAIASPSFGPAPLAVQFDAGASADANQDTDTLRFDWDFGDGTVSPDAGPLTTHSYGAGGTYFAVVTVTDFEGAADTFTVTITVDNSPPQAIIVLPEDGALYDPSAASISAEGIGLDLEDGPEALSLTWSADLHHMDPDDPSQNHVHPTNATGSGPTFSFAHDDHAGTDDVIAYTIRLQVTDSEGFSSEAEAYVFPSNAGVYPWTATDIGAADAGSDLRTHYRGFDVTGAGSGAASAGTADALRFIHRPVTGDFTLTARLDALLPANQSAQAGLLVRGSLDADAPAFALVADSTGAMSLWSRAATGGAMAPISTAAGSLPDLWLQIERAAGSLRVLTSVDGGPWQQWYEAPTALPTNTRVGFFAAGGSATELTTASFREVELAYQSACGDSILDAAEQCDDGNTLAGDCCSATCQFEPAGSACGASSACAAMACGASGICESSFIAGPCDDGDACTANDACAAGICVGGAAPDCDDGNACTDDGCDASAGCVHTDNTTPCDDGDACTSDDACAAGACSAGPDLDCDDGDPCTIDTCDPASGCQHAADPVCADGLTNWSGLRMGTAASGSSVVTSPSSAQVSGWGRGLTGAGDNAQLLHTSIDGDFRFVARIDSLSATSASSTAGLVARFDTHPTSPFVGAELAANGQVRAVWRAKWAEGASKVPGPTWTNGGWLRITRSDFHFTVEASADGAAWTLLTEVTLGMPCAAEVALFSAAGLGASAPATAQFSNVSLLPVGTLADNEACSPTAQTWQSIDIGGAQGGETTVIDPNSVDVYAEGALIWSQADSFRFVYQEVEGDFEVRTQVRYLTQDVHKWTKAGVMLRSSLEANSQNALMYVTPQTGAWFQWRLADGFFTQTKQGSNYSAPYVWLKLVRKGSLVTAFESSNGISWTAVRTIQMDLGTSMYVGVALCSQKEQVFAHGCFRQLTIESAGGAAPVCGNGILETGEQCDDGNTANGDCCNKTCQYEATGSLCAVGNACVAPSYCAIGACVPGAIVNCDDSDDCTVDSCNPTTGCTHVLDESLCSYGSGPWTGTDIGGPTPPGKFFGTASDTFSIEVGGTDIWGQTDSFHFLEQTLVGDFDVRVRIQSLTFSHYWAKAGLMARPALTPNSRNYFVLLPANGLRTYSQWRSVDGGWTSEATGSLGSLPNQWLRLVRMDDTLFSYSSPDGSNWSLIHSTVLDMPAAMRVGPAVTSHAQGTPITATMTDLTVTQ